MQLIKASNLFQSLFLTNQVSIMSGENVSNLQRFNAKISPLDQPISRPSSASIQRISEFYNIPTRPGTAVVKSQENNLLQKFKDSLPRPISSNSKVSPLQELSEHEEKLEISQAEEKVDSGNESDENKNIAQVNNNPEDDVIYLTTQEKPYIPLEMAKFHVQTLLSEIAKTRKKHQVQITFLKTKLIKTVELADKMQNDQGGAARVLNDQLKATREELNALQIQAEEKETKLKRKVKEYKKRVQELEAASEGLVPASSVPNHVKEDLDETAVSEDLETAKTGIPMQLGDSELEQLLKKERRRVEQLQIELQDARDLAMTPPGTAAVGKQASGGDARQLGKLQKQLALETKKFEREKASALKFQKEVDELNSLLKKANERIAFLEKELKSLGTAAVEGRAALEKVKDLEIRNKQLEKENKELDEAFTKERKLRRQYYNELEDLKGKIRVFTRVRPMMRYEKERECHWAVAQQDEMTCTVQTNRGLKEFSFDRVFMPENSQEEVFEDTKRLVQSAIDGFNVCIFAYGQTGSGKTYTMIGEDGEKAGLTPRAFERCFEILEENKKKFSYKVSFNYPLARKI